MSCKHRTGWNNPITGQHERLCELTHYCCDSDIANCPQIAEYEWFCQFYSEILSKGAKK